MNHAKWMPFAVLVFILTSVLSAPVTHATVPQTRPAQPVGPQALYLVYLPLIQYSWILNVRDGDAVARTITVIGTYPPHVIEDLWVFVLPPNGRYYPQSPNACQQERTPQHDGQWEMRVGFGDISNTGLAFQLLLTSATTAASQSIVTTLRAWCQANDYPGLQQLPPGVTLRDQVGVVRTGDIWDIWGPAPLIPNHDLPGSVAITTPVAGAAVPQSTTIKGTYTSDTTADIWVLVYATNGRWYPQSQDACKGRHTQKAGGQWQVRATFGGAGNVGEPFDIVAVVADPMASAFFDATQRQGCAAKNYPGLLTIDLPSRLAEKSRIRVYRK